MNVVIYFGVFKCWDAFKLFRHKLPWIAIAEEKHIQLQLPQQFFSFLSYYTPYTNHTRVEDSISNDFLTYPQSSQMYDILVVNKNYEAEGPDSITLRVGDLVEVLETGNGKSTDSTNAK